MAQLLRSCMVATFHLLLSLCSSLLYTALGHNSAPSCPFPAPSANHHPSSCERAPHPPLQPQNPLLHLRQLWPDGTAPVGQPMIPQPMIPQPRLQDGTAVILEQDDAAKALAMPAALACQHSTTASSRHCCKEAYQLKGVNERRQ